ncbi:MAG: hypothetical protein NXI28_15920 [bacterium]|nr:hypothetical protein [bacterium]
MTTATQPVQTCSQRLLTYLERCNKRGHSLLANQKSFPNHCQLASYCFVDSTTIGRIASGKQKGVKLVTYDILQALAGIEPAVDNETNRMNEQWNRVCDAKNAVGKPEPSADKVLDAIMQGIQDRREAT